MKRLLLLIFLFMCFPAVVITEDSLPRVWSSVAPAADSMAPNYDDDRDYDDYSGRLYIDDINVDVALYNSNKQEVVDRKDSAAYFDLSAARGKMLIADHNTHAFGVLRDVQEGATARIVREDGTVVYYKCVDVFKGHNTGKGITDWNGNSVVGKADLLMYTCFDGWRNVWVVLWGAVEYVNGIDVERTLENFVGANRGLVEKLIEWLEGPGECADEKIELMTEPGVIP